MTTRLLVSIAMFLAVLETAPAQYEGWTHSGSLFILTTPEGANLPATASEENFPLLVRLNKDFFDFRQAKAHGEDIRFSSEGKPLAYQVEEWNPEKGTASLWVRIPAIKGNARQEIKMHWGKADAESESKGAAVFNEANGYLSVWHMDEPAKDVVGTLESKDTGTAPSPGLIGRGRRLSEGKGINAGESIANYPTGSAPHTCEAWFRAEQANATVLAYGNEQAQGKVVLQFVSPPRMRTDCYFSGANVEGTRALVTSQWYHVAYAFKNGEARLYVNGTLDGASTATGAPLNLRTPSRMYIGGWYNHYSFCGDMDEVRISKVTRSADWIKLEYENQKPLQVAVGLRVQPGTDFSVSPETITVQEGQGATVTAKAGGAQKVYWSLVKDNAEILVAVDRLAFTFDAGRVTGDQSLVIRLKAIYADGVKTRDVPVSVKEAIPDPVLSLKAPAKWDGRETIEVVAQVANLKEMQAKGTGEPTLRWTVADIAVIKEATPGKLILKRAQNSGTLRVTATACNGGAEVAATASIKVREPRKDAWVERTPEKDEKPDNNQFYARNDKNEGTLYCNGKLSNAADTVFLKVYADGKAFKTDSRKPGADGSYAFSVRLKPGLVKYSVEFGSKSGTRETVLHTATNLVCGDAFLLDGQSNTVADNKEGPHGRYRSEWIRSFGGMGGDTACGWGNAVASSADGDAYRIGYWGVALADRLVIAHKIPICMINGAVGGTRVDQHLRNDRQPEDRNTIYGRLLARVKAARLTHGIRGVMWHQGENNSGAAAPTGDWDYKSYQPYFVDVTAAWKQDYPNIRHYYVFQVWPLPCCMGPKGAQVREAQRTLPRLYSTLSAMSTIGITNRFNARGLCHFDWDGYEQFATLLGPLVERDVYGLDAASAPTAPDLKTARYTTAARDEIALEFGQAMAWNPASAKNFYLDGTKGQVVSGRASGPVITLRLAGPSEARTIDYLADADWDGKSENLLWGANGIAAFTFCDVPIEASGR